MRYLVICTIGMEHRETWMKFSSDIADLFGNNLFGIESAYMCCCYRTGTITTGRESPLDVSEG